MCNNARAKSSTRLETGMTVRMPPYMAPQSDGSGPWGRATKKVDQRALDFLRPLILHEDDEAEVFQPETILKKQPKVVFLKF